MRLREFHRIGVAMEMTLSAPSSPAMFLNSVLQQSVDFLKSKELSASLSSVDTFWTGFGLSVRPVRHGFVCVFRPVPSDLTSDFDFSFCALAAHAG